MIRPLSLFSGAPLLAIALSSCSSRSEPSRTPSEPRVSSAIEAVPVSRMSIDQFVADIPGSVEGGECQTRELPGLGKQVGLAFPTVAAPVRVVWLTYNEAGNLISYSDQRGDLIRRVVGADGGPPRSGEPVRSIPPAGRHTAIHINLTNRMGLAENIGGGKPPVTVPFATSSKMTAGNLGNPSEMIQLVSSRCPSK